jgi:uncharacterized membrane protein YeaQ/YmgE (transglycosylase-associated protein family)
VSNIIWIIVIGLIAGLIARFVSPGPNGPSGFILTTVLGIVGAFVATFIGQLIGWYQLDQGAGLIGATVGAVIVLFIWNRLPPCYRRSGRGTAGPQAIVRPDAHECLNNMMAKASLLIIIELGAYRSKTWD